MTMECPKAQVVPAQVRHPQQAATMVIVDDDALSSRTAILLVAKMGWLPICVDHAAAASPTIAFRSPAAFIVSPYVEDFRSIRALRARPECAEVPIVATPSVPGDGALAAGATVTVLKPYRPKDLEAVLRELTAGARA